MDPNFVSENGETPLTFASLHDMPEIIILLVQAGGAFVDYRSGDWKTALHKAVMAGHVRAVKSLLSVGTPVDICDKDNLTPLYLASVLGKHSCAESLLEFGAILDTIDNTGRTELHQVTHIAICLVNFFSTDVPERRPRCGQVADRVWC